MKRLQIYIDERLDELLAVRAARERTSKAALIREYVAARFELGTRNADPLDALVGDLEGSRDESQSIDEVVYERTG